MKTTKNKLLLILAAIVLFFGLVKLGFNNESTSDQQNNTLQIVEQTASSQQTEKPVDTVSAETQDTILSSPETADTQSAEPEQVVETEAPAVNKESEAEEITILESQEYDTKDEVALYLYLYGHLPSNYMTKREAREYGWSSGSLHLVVEGKCIGGDRFGNYEGILPEQDGREYYECDIDTLTSKSRGAKRIVYSSDGLIYYTDDHYETFELLYGEE